MASARAQAVRLWLVASFLVAMSPSAGTVFAASVPALPSISVLASNGLLITHDAPIGFEMFMDVLLSAEPGNPVVPVDVYVGAILPDERFVSWVGDPKTPELAVGALPVPLLTSVLPTATMALRVGHTFMPADPHGWYMLYGIIVRAGAGPFDPSRWVNASFFPLLVHPGTCPSC